MRLLVLVLSLSIVALAQPPIKAPEPNPGLPPATPEQIADLTAKLDEMKSLIQAGKLTDAYRINMKFSGDLGKLSVRVLTPEERLRDYERRMQERPGLKEAFLPMAASCALAAGQLEKAEQFAKELLAISAPGVSHLSGSLVSSHVHAAHLLLGRVALQRNHDITVAKNELVAATQISNTDFMQKYGPNMALARDLLASGERDTVLVYLNSFHGLSPEATEKLDHWSKLIQSGAIPDFGANLLFYL